MSLSRRLANLGKAIDSATTGHFLSKGDSDGLFETIQYTDLTGRPTVLDSANITAIVDSAYVQLRQTVAGSGGLDSAAVTTLVDSAYVSARSPAASSGFAAYEYNTSAAQTTFQDSDVNGNVLSYSANGIIVYYNGVLMPTSDYTATDGSSVVFTTAVDSGGTVTIAKWALASSGGSGGGAGPTWTGDRGINAGGSYPYINTMDYFAVATPGNATDFGDLINTKEGPGSLSNATYGLFPGGYGTDTTSKAIDYITVATTSNASDFGDMVIARSYCVSTCGDGTYGLMAGSYIGGTATNTIDYVTIATPGNASDFGDRTVTGRSGHGISNATYGVIMGSYNETAVLNTIDYVTIATPGNASDFGDLSSARYFGGSVSDNTRGVSAGGSNASFARVNTIEYITVDTPSNATDFGDMTAIGSFSCNGASDLTYGVFTRSSDGSYNYSMDYITIQTTGNATDFGDRTENYSFVATLAGSSS